MKKLLHEEKLGWLDSNNFLIRVWLVKHFMILTGYGSGPILHKVECRSFVLDRIYFGVLSLPNQIR